MIEESYFYNLISGASIGTESVDSDIEVLIVSAEGSREYIVGEYTSFGLDEIDAIDLPGLLFSSKNPFCRV